MISRTRRPRTARTRILASMTSALPGIALLLARCPADSLVLLHQLVFADAPGGDHLVQVLRRSAHGLQFGFPAALLRGNIEPYGLAMAHDRQGRPGFEVAREILAEFTHPDLKCFHMRTHCTHFSIPLPS